MIRKNINLIAFYMKISMMVISGVLLSAQLMLAKAADGQVVNRKVTVSFENPSLYSSIKELERRSKVRFSYNTGELKNYTVTPQNFNEAELNEILSSLLKNTNLSYKEVESGIVIFSKLPENHVDVASESVSDKQADIVVKGRVSDEQGPLPGVSVKLLGGTASTTTDIEGYYSISVPESGTLVFSYVGFEAKQVAVRGQSLINVTLVATSRSLQEVVVTGYRAQTRGSITGSVSAVNSSDFKDTPVENLSNALAGRLSGVSISQNAGSPGMESNIRVRALGSTNNENPLFVIDGVITDKLAFDGLSPTEVESVTVLKDGASAAIYGSRSANGVVLVTTKRGKTGAPKLSFSSIVGFQEATKIPQTLNAYEHASQINHQLRYIKVPTTDARYYSEDELEYFKNNSWNWIEEMWRDPLTTQHTLDVSGGSENVKYFLGGSYNFANASFNSIDFKKYTLRGNVDVSVSKNLKISLDLNTDNRNFNGPNWRDDDWRFEDLYKALLFRSSMVPPYVNGLPVGNWVEWHPGEVLKTDVSGYNRREFRGLNSMITLNYKVPFLKGLDAKASLNRFERNTYRKAYSLQYNMNVFNTLGTKNHIVGDKPMSLKSRSAENFLLSRQDQNERYQFNAQLNYKNNFGKHGIDGLFVYEQAEYDNVWFSGRIDQFISPAVDQYIGGLTPTDADGSQSQISRISYVGLASYNYAQKYLLEASFRYDGSVIFAPNRRWGFFPSVSAGWRISEEPFLKNNVNFVNDLKLRGSVALLGDDAVSAFQYSQNYDIRPGALFGNQQSFGLEQGVLANPNITWEKSLSYNGGFDATILNNKVNLKLDLFYRHTYDILGSRQLSLPSTLGADLPDENYQEIDSRGFEVELGFNNKIGSSKNQFNYYLRGNFGYATNKIIQVDEAENIRPFQSAIGRPVGLRTNYDINENGQYDRDLLFGYEATGILRTQADLDALPVGYTILGVAPQLGMLNYRDIRGPNSDTPDGKITVDDREFLAKYSIPPINYGLSLGGAWRSFSLDLLFQGLAGSKSMLPTAGRDIQARAEESSFAYWADSWSPENPNGKYPGYRVGGTATRTRFDPSTFFLVDNSFVRLKNLNISYTLPQRWTKPVGLSNARVFFTGSNLLMVYTANKIYDPEMNNIQSYPMMRTYSFGLNVGL